MIYITPSEVIEYIFCPRFIYYMNVLKIKQREEKRYLVEKGRKIHDTKIVRNKDYIRKKIGCIDKKLDQYLVSERLKLKGKVDEVLFFENNYAAPLDYKYTFWNKKVYNTYKIQQTLYSLLIIENFRVKVEKAFLVYVRTKNKLVEISITNRLRNRAKTIINEIFDIIEKGFYPKGTSYKRKCCDCTYRNLCFS